MPANSLRTRRLRQPAIAPGGGLAIGIGVASRAANKEKAPAARPGLGWDLWSRFTRDDWTIKWETRLPAKLSTSRGRSAKPMRPIQSAHDSALHALHRGTHYTVASPIWAGFASPTGSLAAAGRRMVNTEPLPSSLVTVTSPPIMRASLRDLSLIHI